MASTPNFNWSTPDNTGLVKNGALDIRTLGNAIDSSMADLKGGTTGQVLTKASNTDMDFSWVADATGIPATIFDAKGDIIAATAADTASRLAVGTNGQVLTADSTASTGLAWKTPAGGSSFTGAGVKKSAAQSISNNTFTIITFDQEDFDTNSFHDNSTNNSRITIPTGKGGYYLISGLIGFASNTTGARGVTLLKNGTDVNYLYLQGAGASGQPLLAPISYIAAASAGDYFQLSAYQSSGGSLDIKTETNWQVQYLGA